MAIDNTKPLHLSVNGVLEELDTGSASKITSTLEAHQVNRELNVDGVCKLKFFKVASNRFPFHKEFYRKFGDPEVCDYPLLPLSFNSHNTCAAYKDSYLGKKDWLECKICEQWSNLLLIKVLFRISLY